MNRHPDKGTTWSGKPTQTIHAASNETLKERLGFCPYCRATPLPSSLAQISPKRPFEVFSESRNCRCHCRRPRCHAVEKLWLWQSIQTRQPKEELHPGVVPLEGPTCNAMRTKRGTRCRRRTVQTLRILLENIHLAGFEATRTSPHV